MRKTVMILALIALIPIVAASPPAVEIDVPQTANVGQYFTVTATAVDETQVSSMHLTWQGDTLSKDCSGGGECTKTWTISSDSTGDYEILVDAWDNNLNSGQTTDSIRIQEKQDPELSLEYPKSTDTDVSTSPDFKWSSTNPNDGDLSYDFYLEKRSRSSDEPWSDSPAKDVASPYHVENLDPDTDYVWGVHVTDGKGGSDHEYAYFTTAGEPEKQCDLSFNNGIRLSQDSVSESDSSRVSIEVDNDGYQQSHVTTIFYADGQIIDTKEDTLSGRSEETFTSDTRITTDQDRNSDDQVNVRVEVNCGGKTLFNQEKPVSVEKIGEGKLEIQVKDKVNGQTMKNAKVTLSNGVNKGPKYTLQSGYVTFNKLPINTKFDIKVECYGETVSKNTKLYYDGQEKHVDITFGHEFETRICGEQPPEKKPEASLSIYPNPATVGQKVTFDATSSSDSDGEIIRYKFDLDNDGSYERISSTGKVTRTFNYPVEGVANVKVVDNDGKTSSALQSYSVKKSEKPLSVNLSRPSTGQIIELPYNFRWDASGTNVESTIYIGEMRENVTTLTEDNIIESNVGSSESFTLSSSSLEKGKTYIWGVRVKDDSGGQMFSTVRSFNVKSEPVTGESSLNVLVTDTSGYPLDDAMVEVENNNRVFRFTDQNGETSFDLEPGTYQVTVSKYGYFNRSKSITISDTDEYTTFRLESKDREEDEEDDSDEYRLKVHVEDDDYDEMEDARVTVQNGDYERKHTNDDGNAYFWLEPDTYHVEVQCNGEEESETVEINDDEERVDIRFDEDFESDRCGDDDEEPEEDGLAITKVDYPNSVCRGSSFTADVEIENRGGFHEIVTVTGSGLGSINIGENFPLDIAETRSSSIRFTNVQGSGTEEFKITVTNHDSDQAIRTINVRDCGGLLPDIGTPTGVTAEASPDQIVAGNTVKVKGYVDGVRGRAQVEIRANGQRKATVSTEPDGYYSTYIRVNDIGENIIRVRSGQAETSDVVTAVPVSSVTGISAPDKVFQSESFEVCANIQSQIEPKVFLLKNGEVVTSKFGNGNVCFNRESSETGEHEYQVKALTYGQESSSSTTTVNVLDLGSEVTNFPDQVATTESEEGMVKVELYNTHNDTRRYQINLNGIRTNWLSQSQEEVILTKGERETVYFYITPEDEGSFEPTVTVVSEDTTIYSNKVSVWAGGTKNPRRTSLFGRLSQIFNL